MHAKRVYNIVININFFLKIIVNNNKLVPPSINIHVLFTKCTNY